MADGESRNGPILLMLGVLVLGAGAAGYFLLKGDASPPTDAPDAPRAGASSSRDASIVDNRVRPGPDAEAPVVAEKGDRPTPPAPAPSIAGMPVIAPRADGRELPKELTSKFAAPMTNAIKECAKSIPTENRANSRMTGIVKLGISSGTARVASTSFNLTDVPDGPGKTAALDCLQRAIVGIEQPTTELDVSDYEIGVSFLLFPAATGAAKNAAVPARGADAQSPP